MNKAPASPGAVWLDSSDLIHISTAVACFRSDKAARQVHPAVVRAILRNQAADREAKRAETERKRLSREDRWRDIAAGLRPALLDAEVSRLYQVDDDLPVTERTERRRREKAAA